MENIKIFDISEESLGKLGLALRNNNCRKIMVLLSTKEMYVNQIASELKIGVNIVSDQVKILKQLGLLKIKRKPIVRKGNDHNYYTLKTDIFISTFPEENKIKRIFKEGMKFTTIFLVATFSWFFDLSSIEEESVAYPGSYDSNIPVINSLLIPLIIIIIGLSIERIIFGIKKRKRG